MLRGHLVTSGIPGLPVVDPLDPKAVRTAANNLFKTVNELEVGDYMIATRESMQVVTWLKRACEAIFVDPPAAVQPLAADAAGGPHA